jgi:gliding motility-associated-like protein
VFGLSAQSQPNNLIFNGDFEQWDTSRYVTWYNNKDSVLCKNPLGYLQNEDRYITVLKNINYCRWIYSKEQETRQYNFSGFGYQVNGAFKMCYPEKIIGSPQFMDSKPLNGSTFIMMGYTYDTIFKSIESEKLYRTLFYMRFTNPLIKGKTYQFDFDFKNAVHVYNHDILCPIDSNLDYTKTKMFGFGFTVNQPNYIQDSINFKTNFKPQLPLEPMQSSKWKGVSKYFVADSAYQYLVFGYFGDVKPNHIYSKNPQCFFRAPVNDLNTHYALNHLYYLDNFNLHPYPNHFLPKDTQVCLGQMVNITTNSKKPLQWSIDDVMHNQMESFNLITSKSKHIIIVSDDVVSDTMLVYSSNYPNINIVQTDTLCDEETIHQVFPDTLFYTWLPEQLKQNPVKLKGNEPRTVIASNSIGCSDTLMFTPVLGQMICGSYFIPNAFSPDENGKNEVFKVVGTGIQDIQMEIYNQWGEKIYEEHNKQAAWDGTFKQQKCQEGVYLYRIKVVYTHNYRKKVEYHRGSVTLLK